MLKRIDVFTRFLDDGRICLSNNAAERELRGIAPRISAARLMVTAWGGAATVKRRGRQGPRGANSRAAARSGR
jgi:hypothetical protein